MEFAERKVLNVALEVADVEIVAEARLHYREEHVQRLGLARELAALKDLRDLRVSPPLPFVEVVDFGEQLSYAQRGSRMRTEEKRQHNRHRISAVTFRNRALQVLHALLTDLALVREAGGLTLRASEHRCDTPRALE